MGNSCGACEQLTAGIYLCPGCRDRLIQDLAEVDSVVEDLWTSAAKMDVGAPSVGGGGPAGSTEPANLHAMDKARTLAAVLNGWASALGHPHTDPKKSSSALLAHIREVRGQDWAPVLAQELHDSLNDCRRAMDRAADRVSLGHCLTLIEGQQCPDTITAIVGNAWGRCRTCGATANVAEHQQALMARAGHVRAPLGKLVRALRSAGHLPGVSLKRVENWVARGKLGPVIPFRALYTASDIMDAYLAAEEYKADMAAHIARKKLTQVA